MYSRYSNLDVMHMASPIAKAAANSREQGMTCRKLRDCSSMSRMLSELNAFRFSVVYLWAT
jgi:hypothetical protein